MSSTGVSSGGGLQAFVNSYSISPIVLVGGIASGLLGGPLPISSLLGAGATSSLLGGLLGAGGYAQGATDYGARFNVMSGGSLFKAITATWPLGSQAIAANDQIIQPLRISLEMTFPANSALSYQAKQSVMTALQASLYQHTQLGGWYNVATPSFVYQGCLLEDLHDVSEWEAGAQVQTAWQWDFYQPLITVLAAQGAQNQLMAKVSAGVPITGDPPGSAPATLAAGNPSANLVPSAIPSASSLVTANVIPTTFSNSPTLNSVAPIPPGS